MTAAVVVLESNDSEVIRSEIEERRRPCVVCCSEPMESRIVEAMRRMECPEVTWYWAPHASEFMLAAFDGATWTDASDTTPMSTSHIYDLCRSLATRALLCNEVTRPSQFRHIPAQSPVLILDDDGDTNDSLAKMRKWRTLQSKRVMFVVTLASVTASSTRAWRALGYDNPGVYTWTGRRLLAQR